jgi:WD40 repeat protein
MALHAKK